METKTNLFIAVCCVLMINAVRGHVFKLGSCPKVEAVESFDFDKFMGTWYVIEKFDTSSTCMRMEFGKRRDGSLYAREISHPMSIRTFGEFSQTGSVKLANGDSQGKMGIKYPLSINPFSHADHYVMMTDYDTYAGIWSCRKILFVSYMSGIILSRQRTLDRAIINKIRSRFEYYGVNKSHFSVIEQDGCGNDRNPVGGTLPDSGLRVPNLVSRSYNNETELVAAVKPESNKRMPRYPTPVI